MPDASQSRQRHFFGSRRGIQTTTLPACRHGQQESGRRRFTTTAENRVVAHGAEQNGHGTTLLTEQRRTKTVAPPQHDSFVALCHGCVHVLYLNVTVPQKEREQVDR